MNIARGVRSVIRYATKPFVAFLLSLTLAFGQLVLVVPLAHAAFDTCTWTGATNANWSNSGNWTGCGGNLPEAGDDLTFPNSGSNHAMNNDLSLVFHSITFGLGGSGYSVSGNRLELSTLLNVFDNATFTSGVKFTTAASFAQINVQFATPTFPTAVDLNISVSGSFGLFTTESSVTLPNFTGTTTSFTIAGNPTNPVENYQSSTTPSTFTASNGVIIQRSSFTCNATNCLGADSNAISLEGADDDTANSFLRFNSTGLNFANPVAVANTGILVGPSQLSFAASATLSGTVAFSSHAFVIVDTGVNAVFTGNFIINEDIQLQGAGDYTSSVVHIDGAVLGAGDLYLADNHTYINHDNSSYTGTIYAEAGALLQAEDNNALGDTVHQTVVADGGEFVSADTLTIAEPFTITGTGLIGAGAIVNQVFDTTLSGEITLDGDATIANTSSALTTLALTGKITGIGNLTLAGGADENGMELDGTVSNDYSGSTTILGQNVIFGKTGGAIAIPHDLTIQALSPREAWVGDAVDEQIADDATVTLTNDGSSQGMLLIESGVSETIGTVEGDGLFYAAPDTPDVTLGGGNKSGIFNGEVNMGNVMIHKIGTGTWDMRGVNGDTGGHGWPIYDIQAGSMLANFGDTSGQQSNVNVYSGALLGGSSIVGGVAANGGTISPGNSPGCLYPVAISFSSTPHLAIQLNGTTQCTQYDKLAVAGAVDVSLVNLDLSLGYTSTTGTAFTIVEGSTVTGHFVGLPEGTVITKNGRRLQIHYASTSIVLTDVGADLASNLGNTGTQSIVGLPILFLVGTGLGLAMLRRRSYKKFQI